MTRNMMMTQPYYGGGAEYDPFQRPSHRSMSTAGYYDRHLPYTYYDQPRQELRGGHGGRSIMHTVIHEAEPEGPPGSTRRRISVACSRCRRRKIKCSGDPGDGTGCQACRASGADVAMCTFIRVGSSVIPIAGGVEAYPQASSAGNAPTSGGYGTETTSSAWPYSHTLHSRQSLPTLHTRSSWMDNYDQYESSPADYTYASSATPRQDSIASSYGSIENYRSWGTTAPMSASVNASYYEQPTYSFGSLQTPSYSAGTTSRLPSVTADCMSSLHMGSLYSSLPTQTAQERRLPVPYTTQYPTTTTYPLSAQLPDVRPLGSFSEARAPIHGIHSRNAMPWSMDSTLGSTRTASMSSYPEAGGLPSVQAIQQPASSASTSEPVLGYEFSMTGNTATTGSPEISPTTVPTLSDGYTSSIASTASMPPPSSFRYTSTSHHGLPMVSTDDQSTPTASTRCSFTLNHGLPLLSSDDPSTPAPSRDPPTASLYSFSKDSASDRPVTSDSDQASSSSTASSTASSSGQSYTTERPAQVPSYQQNQHRRSHQHSQEATPRRTTSFEQQQQRAATAQRISVSSLNARC